MNALPTLLQSRSFSKITVNDLCEDAFISRAAFYAHFSDKYDLLDYWVRTLRDEFYAWKDAYTNDQFEEKIYQFMDSNTKVISNLLAQYDKEVWEILMIHMSPLPALAPKNESEETLVARTLLINYCAGGIARMLFWQAENQFPFDNRVMVAEMIRLSRYVLEWDK